MVPRKGAQPLRSLAQGQGCQRGRQRLVLRKGAQLLLSRAQGQGVRGGSSGWSSERGLSHCALGHSVQGVREGSSGRSPERGLSHCALWHSVQGVREGGSGCSSGRGAQPPRSLIPGQCEGEQLRSEWEAEMPDPGRTRLSNLDPQRARGRLGELRTTARLQLESVRVCSSGCSSEKGFNNCALWHSVQGVREGGSGCSTGRGAQPLRSLAQGSGCQSVQ